MVIILSGPSGIGKDTVWIPAAVELGFAKRMMHTTRTARPGERNGIDYWFVSNRRFKSLLRRDELIEWDYYFYKYYGISQAIANNAMHSDLVFHAIARLGYRFRAKVAETVLISLVPSSRDAILERLRRKRHYNIAEMCIRRHHVIEEMDNAFLCNYEVENAERVGVSEAKDVLRRIVDVENGAQSAQSRRRTLTRPLHRGIARVRKNQW